MVAKSSFYCSDVTFSFKATKALRRVLFHNLVIQVNQKHGCHHEKTNRQAKDLQTKQGEQKICKENLKPLTPSTCHTHTNLRHGTTPWLPRQPHVTYQRKQQLVNSSGDDDDYNKTKQFPSASPDTQKILVHSRHHAYSFLKEGGRQYRMLMCVALVWKAWLSCHRCHSHWHCPRRAPLR